VTETILDRFENGTYNSWSPTFIKADNATRIRTINQYSGYSGEISVAVSEKYEVNVIGHNTSTGTDIGGRWRTKLSIDVTNSIFAFVIRKKDGTNITKDEIHDVNLVTSFKQLTDMVSVKMPVLTTSNEDGTKTNILTVNEEVELRGIGDVKDELDLLTGELTQRVGEIVLDKNQTWFIDNTGSLENTNIFYTGKQENMKPLETTQRGNCLLCDTIPIIPRLYFEDVRGVMTNIDPRIYVRIEKTIAPDVESFKTWLSLNPITLKYLFETPIVKTVDLSIVDQDYSKINWLSTFKDTTHISSSSATTNSLVGEFDVVVKTKDSLALYNRTGIKIDPLEGRSISDAITTEGDLVFVGTNSTGQVIYFTVKESTREYLVENVTLSVYRQDYDGRFVTIATDIENLSSMYVTDPHPPLNYVNYRIVVTDKNTGSISYVDIPPYEIGVKSVIIQWGEKWENLTVLGQDPIEQVEWAGSMLKLPYNIDVSDSNTIDVSLVEYIGRAHPVSYYGTQLGVSSTWNVDIPKYDTNTLYGLRLLAIYAGDVYVREPSGSGYWANISVSFSQKHRELTIPVTLNIKRVDGDI
jgi:hypothetical protein